MSSQITFPPGGSGPVAQANSATIYPSLQGAGGLETVETVEAAVDTSFQVYEGSALKIWSLQDGTAATNIPNGILRPLDYAAGTNEKNFIREI